MPQACGILTMVAYSVSQTARILGLDRRTLQRWAKEGNAPATRTQVVAGRRITYWTEADLKELKNYMAEHYWGKGLNRRTGEKARKKKK